MASGAPPLLPLTGVATSNGHRRGRGAAAVKAYCFILLLLLPLSILASKPNRVAFQHMFWRLQGDYDERVRFDAWMHKYKPWYRNNLVVINRRFRSFRDNLRYVDKHNAAANYTYRLGLNADADKHFKEDPRPSPRALSFHDRYDVGDDLPASVDWRLKGAVGPVRDQLNCGSCWAVAAMEAVEGIRQIVTGEDLVPLSVQEILDCVDKSRDNGCSGGYVQDAMEYVINHGVHTEREYPYAAEARNCRKLGGGTARIALYKTVPTYDERSLQKAVVGQPVAVSLAVHGRDFNLYESGVYNGPCGTWINHAALVVGYGSERGKDYWIVKNSWGEDWGEGGYIRIQRNYGEGIAGKCGITAKSIYPTLPSMRLRNTTAT